MSRVVAVAPVLAGHRYEQAEISARIGPLLSSDPGRLATLARFHEHSGVRTRHFALPLESYAGLRSFGDANTLFQTIGTELAEAAVRAALAAADLAPGDVDFLLFTTVTGVGAPSIDAALVERVGLRPDVKRLPSFGLGCVAGASGIARAHDYLAGHPDDVALVVSVELCSLTIQHGDDSPANLVASGLFGDGAAAVVMLGDRRAADRDGLDVLGTRSGLYPDTTGMLGWDVGGSGFRIVLGAGMGDVVEAHVRADVDALLAPHGAALTEVAAWVAHAGGPRILEAATRALMLGEHALDRSRRSLAAVGNLSSSSVLHVLADTLADGAPPPGGLAVLFAFGPGVSAESVLLRRTGGPEPCR